MPDSVDKDYSKYYEYRGMTMKNFFQKLFDQTCKDVALRMGKEGDKEDGGEE